MNSIATLICCVLYFISAEGQSKFYYPYNSVTPEWFKLHRVPASYDKAQHRCNLEGAELASPSDAYLLNAMKALMSKEKLQYKGVLTGFHASDSNGTRDIDVFYNTTGATLPFPWINNKNCRMMLVNGTIIDVKCTEMYPYICYKMRSDDIGCGTYDTEYMLDKRTGSCYKVHTEGQQWPRAYMTCAAEGGYLSIINSDVEAQVLVDIFAKYPDDTLSAAEKGLALIGVHDWGEHGLWWTIHGKSLKEAGYNKWAAGQPNNLTTGQFCGSMERSGLLNDIWCNKRVAFICEKDSERLSQTD